MGDPYPSQFPAPLRLAAVILAVLLTAMASVVLARWNASSQRLIWAVVVLTFSLGLTLMTPSVVERTIWAPTAALLMISSVTVAVRHR